LLVSAPRFDVYLDESGNSGRNYLAFQQPYYLLSGWAVDDAKAAACRDEIVAWEAPFRKRGMKEPKASTILQRPDGPEQVLALMSSLLEKGAIPTCCVFEKRFGVCMNVSEAFFGITQHLKDFPEFVRDARDRNETASILFENLSDEALIMFARASYDRDPDAFKQAKDRIREELYGRGIHDLGFALDFVPTKISADFAFDGDNPANSINATVFQTQLMMLEGFARQRNSLEWSIKHDQILEFAKVLSDVTQLFASQPDGEFKLDNGLVFYLGKLRLEKIEFLDSSSNEFVRAADYYSGLLNFVFVRGVFERFNGRNKATLQALLHSPKLGHPPLNFFTLAPNSYGQLVRWLRS
jgi:hypothetical protein